MVRHPDWRTRLTACFEAALGRPFEWGRQDCVLFAADAVLAMTGEDPAGAVRGRYATALGAKRLLRRAGYFDVDSAAAASFSPVATAMASDGDIAVLRGPSGRMLGIFAGELVAAPGAEGLGFVPRDQAILAFHVPFESEVR